MYTQLTTGLIGERCAYLDHIAPLCDLLNVPLLTHSLETKLLSEKYYPQLYCQLQSVSLEELLQNYDTLLYPFKWDPLFYSCLDKLRQTDIYNPLYRKKMKLIYTTHGCSDKGYKSDTLCSHPHLKEVDLMLTNGNRMADIFKTHKTDLKNLFLMGNLRYSHYQLRKNFQDRITEQEIFSQFKKQAPTLLYAPSFQDKESSSSLITTAQFILEKLPKHFNLIIKFHPQVLMHPNSVQAITAKQLIQQFSKCSNILFIIHFPLVYPILQRIDAYIGDHSSVSYDVLAFNKPMYFINPNNYTKNDPSAFIQQCGRVITTENFPKLYSIIDKNLEHDKKAFLEKCSDIYHYAFGKNHPPLDLKRMIEDAIDCL